MLPPAPIRARCDRVLRPERGRRVVRALLLALIGWMLALLPAGAQGTVLPSDAGSHGAGSRGDTAGDVGARSGGNDAAAPLGQPRGDAAPGPSASEPQSGGLGQRSDLGAPHLWWEFRRESVLLDRPMAARGDGAAAPSILPALLAALEPDTPRAPLSGAILAAANLADDAGSDERRAVVARLERLVRHPDARVVEAAVLGLGLAGGERTALLLVDLLRAGRAASDALGRGRDADPRLRCFSAVALGLVAGEASGLAAGDAPHPDLARLAVHHLAATIVEDDVALDLCISSLLGLSLVPLDFEPVSRGRGEARRARPASASGDAQLEFLLHLWDERSLPRRVAPHLVTALAALVAERETPRALRRFVVEALVEALGDRRDAELRQAAALGLGWIADADEDPADERARRALARATENAPDGRTRSVAWASWIEAASRAGRRGEHGDLGALVEAALARCAATRGQERAWATWCVGWCADRLAASGTLPPPELARFLVEKIANEKSPLERASLAAAIGLAGAEAGADAVRQAFAESRDESVRSSAALALGLLGDPADAELLTASLARSQHEPRTLREVSLALGRVGGADASRALREALAATRSLPARGSLAAALGSFQDRRSVAALLALFQDEATPDEVRAYAAIALGRAGDGDVLPWRARIARRVTYFSAPPVLYDEAGNGILNLL
ncbi:MAG: HEAT repeat domain-containing protein [Planctomycetota bacterium]